MGLRGPKDNISWSLYRRAWVIPALAFVLLFVTSFQPETPQQSTLPPTLRNDQAAALIDEAKLFSQRFPDRRAGTTGGFESAQWMLDEFQKLGLKAQTVPATTISPRTNKSIGVVNVEAVLPGRTRELIVVLAHRDTADSKGQSGDAVGQMALLTLAKELQSTRDRRRTYMFVSTDAATLNGAGARALAERLSTRGAVVSIFALDRLDAGEKLRVSGKASGTYAPPLGLVQITLSAVRAEGGKPTTEGLFSQLSQLAAPITLYEHGQLLQRGLPAITITGGDDKLRSSGEVSAAASSEMAVGSGLRSVQRLFNTLDQVDQLQTAGKTWAASDKRVFRGWALKIFIASLLVPVWVGVVDQLVRNRKGWNLFAALGSAARSMMAGVFAVGLLWVLGGVGILTHASDRPPNPLALQDARTFGLFAWLFIVVLAWLVARGPDWRRRVEAVDNFGRNSVDLVMGLMLALTLAGLGLAVNPYTVFYVIPALHVWLWLTSQHTTAPLVRGAVWSLGAIGPLVAIVKVGSPVYMIHLAQSRTIPPLLSLLIAAGCGLSLLLLNAVYGRIARPALPHLREVALYADLRVSPQRFIRAVRGVIDRVSVISLPRKRSRRRVIPSLPKTKTPRLKRSVTQIESETEAAERRVREARLRAERRARRHTTNH